MIVLYYNGSFLSTSPSATLISSSQKLSKSLTTSSFFFLHPLSTDITGTRGKITCDKNVDVVPQISFVSSAAEIKNMQMMSTKQIETKLFSAE